MDPGTKAISIYTDTNVGIKPDGSIIDGIRRLESADCIIAHNIIGYDAPAIKKLYPWVKLPKLYDTLILTQLFWANQMYDPSLAAWGRKFGIPKPTQEHWQELSRDMLNRCIIDTKILVKVWELCDRVIKKDPSWESVIDFENEVYQTLIDSECYWPINLKLVYELRDRAKLELDSLLGKLKQLHGGYLSGNKMRALGDPDPIIQPFTQNGALQVRHKKFCEETGSDPSKFYGEYSRLYFHEFNPASPDQVREWFLRLGWKPKMFTYETDDFGKPLKDEDGEKVKKNESTSNDPLHGVPTEIKETYKKFKDIQKVYTTYLTKWIEKHQIYKGVPVLRLSALTTKTCTARWGHRLIANIPAPGATYGQELRSCFIARPGYKLVGCDASQLEAMIEGHYVYEFDNGARLLDIQSIDVHQKLADDIGVDRKTAKVVNYAVAYGCGAKHLSEILDCSEEQAWELYNGFWDSRWELKKLIEKYQIQLVQDGFAEPKFKTNRKTGEKTFQSAKLISDKAFIRAIDGRRTYIRYAHNVNNTLIQSAGAILVKWAYVELAKRIKAEGLDARIALLYHDEYNVEVKDDPETIKRVEELCIDCLRDASYHFKLNCTIKGEAKIGNNWYEVH
jgi:hypothetical protein